jgi:2-polyprenyl-3-methyl-5-hydroxy-6-metoxy-1,4-benzoquinol methylase
VSNTAIEFCSERGLKVSKGNIDDSDFRLEGVFDHIIISEALEHIVNPEELLQKLRNNYNKSIIVTIPNTGYFMHRLSLLLGTFPVQWIHHPAEHLRFWTLSDFKNTLKIVGYNKYKIHSIKGVGLLQRIWPSMFSAQTLFILQ